MANGNGPPSPAAPDALSPPPDAGARAAAALRDAFLAGRNANTRRAYEQTAADFASYLTRVQEAPRTEPEALATLLRSGLGRANLLALEYRADLLERQLAPGTVALRLSNLRSMVKLARTLGLVEWVLEVPSVRVERYRDTSGPGVAGVQAIADLAHRRDDVLGARDRALIALLFFQGLRRAEAAELDLEHVDEAGGRISILGKGKLEREWVVAAPEALEALGAWIRVRPDIPSEEQPLFLGFEGSSLQPGGRLSGRGIAKIVGRYGLEALGTTVRPHGLRHAAVTALLDLGMSWAEVAGFTRHADPSTLKHYDDNRTKRGSTAARKLGELVKL